jgi:nucleotide-binding universal stress UspA family protein
MTPTVAVTPTFQNILFATDFSPCSDAALLFARGLADRFGSTLHLVHVTDGPSPDGELGAEFPELKRPEREAHELLEKLAKSDALRGVQCTQTVTQGEVAHAIIHLSQDAHLDLIVLGTHGRHGLRHLILGSVAEQVFRNANCPVLTVGPQVSRRGLALGKVGAILFATDFSPASLHAFEYALPLARVHRAKVVLVHAVEGNPPLLNFADDSMVSARRRLGELVPPDTEVETKVVVEAGPAAPVILRTASEATADLIVTGVHRRLGASGHHLPWATAHEVLCSACCPVLTVHS